MTQSKILFILILSTILFGGCAKEEDEESSNATYVPFSIRFDCTASTNCPDNVNSRIARFFFLSGTDCSSVQTAGALSSYVAANAELMSSGSVTSETTGDWTDGTNEESTERVAGGTYTVLAFVDDDGDIASDATAPSAMILETGDPVCCKDNVVLNASTSGGGNTEVLTSSCTDI